MINTETVTYWQICHSFLLKQKVVMVILYIGSIYLKPSLDWRATPERCNVPMCTTSFTAGVSHFLFSVLNHVVMSYMKIFSFPDATCARSAIHHTEPTELWMPASLLFQDLCLTLQKFNRYLFFPTFSLGAKKSHWRGNQLQLLSVPIQPQKLTKCCCHSWLGLQLL